MLRNDTRVTNILKNIHDQYATPRLISMMAKKFVSTTLLTQGIQPIDHLVSILDQLIVDEIKFYDMESNDGGNKKSNVVPTIIKWEDVGGLHNIKTDLVKILQWPIKVFTYYT